MLCGCPLVWCSKLQPLISLSTMEAEYIALSTSMRELVPLRELVTELAAALKVNDRLLVRTHSTVFEDNNGALTFANLPRLTPRSNTLQFIGIGSGNMCNLVVSKSSKLQPLLRSPTSSPKDLPAFHSNTFANFLWVGNPPITSFLSHTFSLNTLVAHLRGSVSRYPEITCMANPISLVCQSSRILDFTNLGPAMCRTIK